ncbi:MAG TPA: dicarboxylate/amino acid:cation symporter [Bacteroidales bacterium]|jgi:proton glutamate symport protein|nr:dicarboxylate/amino acid:cation symporter [Bacteroidales bacterium]
MKIRLALHWQILIGILLGALLGSFFSSTVPTLSVLGTLFLRGLKMIVVPLIISSLVVGVTNIGTGKSLGRIGGKTLTYYLSTSFIAIITGLFFVNVLKPGIGTSIILPTQQDVGIDEKSFKETLINIIPENIFDSMANADMLALIFFSIVFGIFITKLDTSKKNLLTNVFDAVFETMMKITLWVIRFAPLGVMGIVAEVVSEQDNLLQLVGSLGKFAGVVVISLGVHFFVTLPILLFLLGKTNPVKHYQSMFSVILTAFSTASSNATLPLTLETVEEKSGVSNKVASFTLPLGATINMDGTALYELVVAGFVAQLYGIELSITQQFIMVSTALLASIGTAGIPMASFVTMTIVFTSVGLPLEAMLIVMPVDRPLDMLRTATNVFSDSCGSVIIAKSEGEKLNY